MDNPHSDPQDDAAPHPLVRLEPDEWTFPCAPGQTVLEAGLAAGLEMDNSCRNGTCRTCLCQLREGEVRYRIDWPGVSAEEKAEGWFLPCVAEACSDLVVHQPMAWPTTP